jgi:membrane-bound serine protease (ClpP class)
MNKRAFLFVAFILVFFSAIIAHTERGSKEFVYTIEVEGTIDAGIAHFVEKSIEKAQRDNVPLIIQLDTPGGLYTSTKDIVDQIRGAEVEIVVWVTPEGAWAFSAGTYILLASDVAAMDNGTSIGAVEPRPADPKMIEAMVSWIRGLAEKRGVENIAENFVRYNDTMGPKEAFQAGVIELRASDIDEILDYLGLPDAEVRTIEMGIFDKFLRIISNPQIVLILFIVGMLGIIFEITTPGVGVPGVGGGICLLLALWGLGVLEINVAAIALLVLGGILITTEIFVPGFGVFGIGGIVALAFGLIMVDKEPWVEIAGNVVKGIILGLVAVFAVVIVLVRRAMKKPAIVGREELIGKSGIAITDLAPKGLVKIKGESWSAICKTRIKKGEKVIVKDVKGVTLIVKKSKEKS